MQQSIKKYKELYILGAVCLLVFVVNVFSDAEAGDYVLATLFLGFFIYDIVKRLTTEEAINGVRNKIRSALDIIILLLAMLLIWDHLIFRLILGYPIPLKYDISVVVALILGIVLISRTIDPHMPRRHRTEAANRIYKYSRALIGAAVLIIVGFVLFSLFFK